MATINSDKIDDVANKTLDNMQQSKEIVSRLYRNRMTNISWVNKYLINILQPHLGEIAIEASTIVSRLEKVADGIALPENNQQQQHQPTTVFLGLDKKHSDEIVHIIEHLISTDDDGEPLSFPPLDSVTKLAMVSHSLAAYCGGLDRSILQKLSTRFTTDTTRWISQLFGYFNNYSKWINH